MLHEFWMPGQLITASQQCCSQICISTTVADVPLATRHDLERTVSLFIKLDRVTNRFWLATQVAARSQHLDNGSLCLLHGLACKCRVVLETNSTYQAVWRLRQDATIATNYWSSWQIEFTPPHDVGEITERTDHCYARTFVDLCKFVCEYRYCNIKQWCAHHGAKKWFVAVVIRVSNERNASRNEFWPSSCDQYFSTRLMRE